MCKIFTCGRTYNDNAPTKIFCSYVDDNSKLLSSLGFWNYLLHVQMPKYQPIRVTLISWLNFGSDWIMKPQVQPLGNVIP